MLTRKIVFGIVLCIFAAITVGGIAALRAPARWSRVSTWDGRIPVVNGDVTVPKGRTIVLDVSPPPLRHLQIDGTLIFADKALTLTAESITVRGRLQIGTAARPFQSQAKIVLTGAEPPDRAAASAAKMISVLGGVLEIHGQRRAVSWTRLADTAAAGADALRLAERTDWRAGDSIVVASTDFDPAQCEVRRIIGGSGGAPRLDAPLRYTHWGRDEDGVGERAEVGLLSRNIVVSGDEASEAHGFGGQVMIMDGGAARIDGAEFTRMGQKGRLRCYPIHFHLLGDSPSSYVRDTSIHHCYNRAITIHGTNRVHLDSNVAFDTIGHCYFLEDGMEKNNVVTHNLGLMTRKAKSGEEVLPTDLTPATFWITNPANIVRDNAAAGSEEFGFWYALPKHPTGASQSARNDRYVWPRRLPLGEFRGNVAHSNGRDGLFVDGAPNPPGVTEAPDYDPHAGRDLFGPGSHPVTASFAEFTSYKNRRHGVWMRGLRLRLEHARLADNAIGVTLASSLSEVTDSLIVGDTANLGTPAPGETTGPDGRGLPKPWDPKFPMRGFEFYDGRVALRRTTFIHFQPNAVRQAGALGYLQYTPFFIDPRNSVEGCRFLDSNTVYLKTMPPVHNKAVPGDGYRTAVFVDADGGVTGLPGASVTVNNPFLVDAHAKFMPSWNAYISRAPYGRLFVDNRETPRRDHGPVLITRCDLRRAKTTLWGSPGAPPDSFQSTVIANQGYAIKFRAGQSPDTRYTLRHRNPGDFVTLTLPSTANMAVYANNDLTHAIAPASSRAVLDGAQATCCYQGCDALYVKLVVPAGSDRAVAEVKWGK